MSAPDPFIPFKMLFWCVFVCSGECLSGKAQSAPKLVLKM